MSNQKDLDDLMNHKAKTTNPAEIDSDLAAASDLAKARLADKTSEDDLTQKVINRLKAESAKGAMGNTVADTAGFARTVSKSAFQPDVQIIPPQSTAEQNGGKDAQARPASKIDLANITEA